MVLFKEAEHNPGVLTKRVLYDRRPDNTAQNFTPSTVIEKGRHYTLEELGYRMIVYSDNSAQSLLLNNLHQDIFDHVYQDLGVPTPDEEKPDNFLTVKEYATFFRILFNASYLNKDFSEKALQYMSRVEFRDGLVAGVPPGTDVTHKFGERAYGVNNSVKQLHDCGIVYYPDHPYLICVMSRGSSFQPLNETIKEISRLAYTEVDKHNRGQ
jgi:beta-lactamase class A